jgi:hypothetical protein
LVTEEGNAPVPMTTFRVWIPVGPMEVEEMSWSFVEREAPAWYRDLTRKSYVRTFGTSGIFEQDDFEIFAGITRSTASPIGSRQQLNYQMGMHKDPVTDWPGPGIAIGDDFSEANQRAFYERWVEELIRV